MPIVNFAAGGITTPADGALLMNLGCDGVFVGSGIFKSDDPAQRARAVVLATTFHDDSKIVMEAQKMVDEKSRCLDWTQIISSFVCRKGAGSLEH